jgi:hypothetical protein
MNQAAMTDLPTVTGWVKEQQDACLVLDIPETDYRLHLVPSGPQAPTPGTKVTGRIYAQAKRVDPIRSGGRFIEPNYGRPRRVQGMITGGDPQSNRLYVNCGGAPFIATLMPAQKATDFAVGQMVLFDVERGATFEMVT